MRLLLHPTQSQVFKDRSRFRVLVAGRRWGKTWIGKAELARGVREAGSGAYRFWYVAPTYREARDIFWGDCKAFFRALGWLAAEPNESRLELDLISGAQVALKGADKPESLRGRGLKGVILDEFATMKPETWTESIRPALSDAQGWALFIGTPQAYNHLHDLYQRGQASEPNWASWQFRTIDGAVQPWGPMLRSEIDDARRDLDERTFRQEYEASFEALSGRVYYAFARERQARPVVLDRYAPVCVSFDFNIDPATAVIGQVDAEGRCAVWREVYLNHCGGEATLSAARRVTTLLTEAGHTGPVRVYGDSTGKAGKTTGPSDHAVLRAAFPSAAWRIPHEQPHVRDRIAAVNGRCRSAAGDVRLAVDPSCTRLMADLEGVQFTDRGEIDKDTNPALTHISDALGYWLVRDFPPVRRSLVGAA